MSQDFDPIYQDYILDLYRHPHNAGLIEHANAMAEEFNPSCGDRIKLTITFDGEVVKDIKHASQGCAISQASVSLLTDFAKGKNREELKKITEAEAMALLNIPISHTRRKCAILGWLTLQKAL